MANMNQFTHSHFDGPIPGESLTATPGNALWQHPPQHTDLDQALSEVWERLMQPKQCAKLLTLLEAGVPAQAVADVILFAGFGQGMWNPDLAILMAKPVWAMVAAIGHRAKINFKLKTKTEDELDQFLSGMHSMNLTKPTLHADTQKPAPMPEPPKSGLMGARK